MGSAWRIAHAICALRSWVYARSSPTPIRKIPDTQAYFSLQWLGPGTTPLLVAAGSGEFNGRGMAASAEAATVTADWLNCVGILSYT